MPRRRTRARRYASDNFGNGTTPPISVDPWPRSDPRRTATLEFIVYGTELRLQRLA